MTRVLVTGGAGFIGTSVTASLVGRGVAVTVLDSLSEQVFGARPDECYTFTRLKELEARGVRFVQADVRDRAVWNALLPAHDAVLHLAAETGTGQSMYQVAHYTEVNVGGTALLLDVLANGEHEIRRLVVASSRSVYGEGKARCGRHGVVYPEPRRSDAMLGGDFAVKCPVCGEDVEALPTDEESSLKPSSVYAVTKLAQEQMVLAVAGALGIGTVAIRYQNVYGPGQSLVNPYTGILSIFSTALFEGQPINVFEDGLESRDFVYVEDVADATVAALLSDDDGRHVINVGSGVPTSVLEVLAALGRAYGITPEYEITGNFRAGDIRHNFADIGRARDILGFAPRWDFADGIERFAGWVAEERSRATGGDSGYQRSLEQMRIRGLLR